MVCVKHKTTSTLRPSTATRHFCIFMIYCLAFLNDSLCQDQESTTSTSTVAPELLNLTNATEDFISDTTTIGPPTDIPTTPVLSTSTGQSTAQPQLWTSETVPETTVTQIVDLTGDESTVNSPTSTPSESTSTEVVETLERPLYLTTSIEAGDLEKARQQSLVNFAGLDVTSYAGLITINAEGNSNVFFWFFPATEGNSSAPLLINLGGGTGLSSLEAVFGESGPYRVTEDQLLVARKDKWTSRYNVLYIDAPLGAGFSFTDREGDYADDSTKVSKQIYKCLLQFFTLFHEFRNHELYLVGNSYAGKFAENLAHYIHFANDFSPMQSNLRGLILLSGLMEPFLDLTPANYLYQVGLLSQRQVLLFKELTDLTVEFMKSKSFTEASYITKKQQEEYRNITGLASEVDIVSESPPSVYEHARNLVRNLLFRNAIHVGNLTYRDGSSPADGLPRLFHEDQFKSYSHKLEFVIDNNYKVLVVGGQFDAKYNPAATDQALSNLHWKSSGEYFDAVRSIYGTASEPLSGYVTTVKNLRYVMLRKASHYVTHDQPEAVFIALKKFISNEAL